MDAFLKNLPPHSEEYKYIAFEPVEEGYKELKRKCVDKQFIAFKSGVWNKNCTLKFYTGEMLGAIGAENTYAKNDRDIVEVEVKALDEVPECQNASFIKMDIEGSEMEALIGAKNIIKKNKPKLAICIYHSDKDMIRIIEFIHSMVPEYKLYVRHHSFYSVETVLYAVT